MKRNSVLIIVSCFIGLVTASAYSFRVQHLRDEIAQLSERIPVITVTRDVQAGERLLPEDLTSTMLLKEHVPGRSIPPEDVELVLGRKVLHPVPARDPLLWTDFPEGPRVRNPSERIPPGYRAMALSADEIHTLVHFISPGDTIDVVSSTFEKSGTRLISRIVGKNIYVLAVGRQLEGGQGNGEMEEYPVSVTLLVDPANALKILQASQTGEIHFLARGSDPLTGPHKGEDQLSPGRNHPGEQL